MQGKVLGPNFSLQPTHSRSRVTVKYRQPGGTYGDKMYSYLMSLFTTLYPQRHPVLISAIFHYHKQNRRYGNWLGIKVQERFDVPTLETNLPPWKHIRLLDRGAESINLWEDRLSRALLKFREAERVYTFNCLQPPVSEFDDTTNRSIIDLLDRYGDLIYASQVVSVLTQNPIDYPSLFFMGCRTIPEIYFFHPILVKPAWRSDAEHRAITKAQREADEDRRGLPAVLIDPLTFDTDKFHFEYSIRWRLRTPPTYFTGNHDSEETDTQQDQQPTTDTPKRTEPKVRTLPTFIDFCSNEVDSCPNDAADNDLSHDTPVPTESDHLAFHSEATQVSSPRRVANRAATARLPRLPTPPPPPLRRAGAASSSSGAAPSRTNATALADDPEEPASESPSLPELRMMDTRIKKWNRVGPDAACYPQREGSAPGSRRRVQLVLVCYPYATRAIWVDVGSTLLDIRDFPPDRLWRLNRISVSPSTVIDESWHNAELQGYIPGCQGGARSRGQPPPPGTPAAQRTWTRANTPTSTPSLVTPPVQALEPFYPRHRGLPQRPYPGLLLPWPVVAIVDDTAGTDEHGQFWLPIARGR